MKPSTNENIYSLKGFSKVFKFTVVQNFKNKALVFELLFVIMIFILQTPLIYIIEGGTKKMTATIEDNEAEKIENVKKVYIYNNLETDIEDMLRDKDGILNNIPIENVEDYVDLDINECLVELKLSFNSYQINAIRSDGSSIPDSELQLVRNFVEETFTKKLYDNCGLTEENQLLIQSGSYVSHISEDDYFETDNHIYSDRRVSSDIMSYVILIFLVVALTGSYIIVNVSLEKTSKLAETILVSVRPMALLAGKIIGILSVILGALLLGVAGSKLCDYVMINVLNYSMESVQDAGFSFSILGKYGIKGSIIMFVCLLISISILSVLGATIGSACNKTEDLQTAQAVPLFVSMAGYFGAFALYNAPFAHIVSITPPFSLFLLPIMYLTGRISLILFVSGLLIEVAILILLIFVAAKVYKKLLLSGNSKPKLSVILKNLKG